jgi:hypothetical protein
MPCVLGPARALQALQGGTATHDPSASHKSAAWLRGGLLPQASGSLAARRAPRDRGRRRTPLRRTRAARFAPVHNTPAPYPWPNSGKTRASNAPRAGGAERLHAPAVHKTSAVALAHRTSDDALLRG